jgi:biofilm protein TabA
MIVDHLSNLSFYLSIHPLIAIIDPFMKNKAYQTLALGSHWLQEPKLRVIKETNQGKGNFKGTLEIHRKHIDIQIALNQPDRIGYRSLLHCNEPQASFDPSLDIQFFNDRPDMWIDLPKGYFCMLFPQDAHAPLSTEGEIEKIIFKLQKI